MGGLGNQEGGGSALHKKTKNYEVLFSLAWNIIFSDNFKVLVLKFFEMKDMVFLSQKVDGNIFTDY